MEASSRRKSKGSILRNAFQRSISPSGRFCSSISSSSAAFGSSISSLSTQRAAAAGLFTRSTSPTRVNMRGRVSSSPSVRFSIDRPTSPSRSLAASPRRQKQTSRPFSGQKKTCMCSPTTHPGSFRCSLHKNGNSSDHTVSYRSNRLNARRSAMTNSLVRIGTVEGDLVKRALAALIRPSSHQLRRRADFQARPSRLSIMSKAEDSSNIEQIHYLYNSSKVFPVAAELQ